jgi:hypothetical protein
VRFIGGIPEADDNSQLDDILARIVNELSSLVVGQFAHAKAYFLESS